MKKFAVVLAGCGSMDGSEVHEATLALYAISSLGGEYQIYAPNRNQADVMNHLEKEQVEEQRNVMVEAARIARGNVKELSTLDPSQYDALIIPGGFGTAKNLFTYAHDGVEFTVFDDIKEVILSFSKLEKPIGAMCIAPIMLANVLGFKGVKVTLGPAMELACSIDDLYGATLEQCDKSGIVVDKSNKVVTTPAYMYGDNTIAEVGEGALNMVKAVLELM